MKIKHILLIIAILELLLITVVFPTKEDLIGFSFHTDTSDDLRMQIGSVHRIGYEKSGWFDNKQLPTTMFKNTSNLHTYKQKPANYEVFNEAPEASYAVLPMMNASYPNEQVGVHYSDLNNYLNNNKIYSSTRQQNGSPVLNGLNNKLALLFPGKTDGATPVILDESTSKIQYGFLAISSSTHLENTAMGGENLEKRRYGNIDPDGDPEGPPIPIPDGFWVLLVFAFTYAGWINKYKLKIKKTQIADE